MTGFVRVIKRTVRVYEGEGFIIYKYVDAVFRVCNYKGYCRLTLSLRIINVYYS